MAFASKLSSLAGFAKEIVTKAANSCTRLQRTNQTVTCLLGAPGSGKGRMLDTVMQATGSSQSLVASEMLRRCPTAAKAMDAGDLLLDNEVIQPTFREILSAVALSGGSGVVVDGFPRSSGQIASLTLLRQKLEAVGVRLEVLVLDIDKATSLERQLGRAKKDTAHNTAVMETGVGTLKEIRATDEDDKKREKRFAEWVAGSGDLRGLPAKGIKTHFVNASGSPAAVQELVRGQFQGNRASSACKEGRLQRWSTSFWACWQSTPWELDTQHWFILVRH